jgi:hypothetical protein
VSLLSYGLRLKAAPRGVDGIRGGFCTFLGPRCSVAGRRRPHAVFTGADQGKGRAAEQAIPLVSAAIGLETAAAERQAFVRRDTACSTCSNRAATSFSTVASRLARGTRSVSTCSDEWLGRAGAELSTKCNAQNEDYESSIHATSR